MSNAIYIIAYHGNDPETRQYVQAGKE